MFCVLPFCVTRHTPIGSLISSSVGNPGHSMHAEGSGFVFAIIFSSCAIYVLPSSLPGKPESHGNVVSSRNLVFVP